MDDAGDPQTRQVIWYVQFLFHIPSVYICSHPQCTML